MSTRKNRDTKNESSTWWKNLDGRTKHLLCLAILFTTPFFVFPEVVFEGKKFFAHDEIQYRAGSKSIADYRETYNEEPLWASNMFSGMPSFLVSYAKSVPHLEQLIRNGASGWFPISIFWSALFGGYFFFYVLARSHIGAAFSAVSASFTTYLPIIVGAGHNTKLLAFSIVGWLLGFLLLTLKSKKPFLPAVAFSIFLAVQLRANHPQVTYYFAFLGLGIVIYYGWKYFKDNQSNDFYKRLGLLFGGALLALAVIVQPYWATLEYSPYSIRGGSTLSTDSGLNEDYAMAWSQGWTELLTVVAPAIMGGSSSEGTYWGPKSFTSGPHYFGVLTITFALIALFSSVKRVKFTLLAIVLLSAGFSLGENFLLLNGVFFDYFPLFNKFRTPEMWLLLTSFTMASLAALGFAHVENSLPKLSELKIPLSIALGISIVILVTANSGLSFQKDGERMQLVQQVASQNGLAPSNPQVQQMVSRYVNNQLVPKRQEKATSDANRVLIFTLLTVVVIYVVHTYTSLSTTIFLLLIFINLVDLGSVGRRYLSTEGMIDKNIAPERVLQQYKRPVDSWIQERIKSQNEIPYRVFPLDSNPFNSAIPSAFYPSIGGYSGAKMSIYQDMIENALYSDNGLNDGVLDMLNVKYITSGFQIPGNYKEVYSSSGASVFENPDVLEKAFFVGNVKIAKTPIEAISLLNTIKPELFAVLETSNVPELVPDSSSTVDIVKYSEKLIELTTKSSTQQLLVISEIYYPKGWTAFIDGVKAEILKTNYVLRGVVVPAGEHSVTFEFNPQSHTWGSTISWTAALLQLVLLGFGVFMQQRKD